MSLSFSVNELIIKEEIPFDIASFASIEDSDTKTEKFGLHDEIATISKTNKYQFQNRFIGISITRGDRFPYSEKVVGPDMRESDNPRPPDQIEMSKQFFALVDTETQRIYLSDIRKRKYTEEWLNEKIGKEVIIKSIISQKEFIDSIKTIEKVSFSVVPNLFTACSTDTLSSRLVDDIYGFGAEKARLELSYKDRSTVTEKIRDRVNLILCKENEYQDISVIGRTEDNVQSVLNLHEVTRRVVIDIQEDELSKLFDPQQVFTLLIEKVGGA